MPSWPKFAMLFVMGLIMVLGLGDNSGVDAGWFPGKLVGRTIVRGVQRRQERRAARRGCGAEAVEAVQVQSSGCHSQASCHGTAESEVVPAPVNVEAYSDAATTIKRGMPAKHEAELSPEEEQRIRDSIADMREKLKMLEQMIELRKQLTARTQ